MDNHIRICILIHEIITEIIQKYLEFKIQPQTFEIFLTSQQHFLYHLCFNKGRCCSCGLHQRSPLQQIVRKPQFVELFKQQGSACGRTRNCCCMFNATPNINTNDIDITLCIVILFNCYNWSLQQQEEIALKEIREARNVFSHSKNNNNMTTSEFKRQWNTITNAGKCLAKCTSRQYFEEIEDRMLRLECRAILSTDHTESYRRLAEEKVELNETLHNVDDRLNNIESRLEKVNTIESKVNNVQTVFSNCNIFLVKPETCESTVSTERQLQLTHHPPLEDHGEDAHTVECSYHEFKNKNNTRESEMLSLVPYTENASVMPISVDNEDTLQPVLTEYTSQTSDVECSGTLIPIYDRATKQFDDQKLDGSLLHDTECKAFAVDPPLQESDSKHFQLYNVIETMRTQGRENFLQAINYCLLIYIKTRGSSSVKDIDLNLLQKIFVLVHHFEIDLQHINVRQHLEDLTKEYIDRIGKIFTIRDTTTTSALQSSFGYAFPDSFVEICNADILLNHIRPYTIDYEHSNLIVRIYPDILIDSLVQKLQYKIDAFSVGEYMHVMHEHDLAGEFCEKLLQCDIDISANSTVEFLDGVTGSGQDLTLFIRNAELYDVICRSVDDAGNTVIHHMVATINESERFLLYIEFFCEHKFDVMQLNNNFRQTPVDIAAYLGRFEVISSILCRCSKSEKENIISKIFSMLQKGVELYNSILAGSPIQTEITMDLDTVSFGDVEDYQKILKAIGKENECKVIECELIKSEDDISAIIGKGVVNIVTDVKKGLNAFSKIPALVKIVNKVTKLIED